MHDTAQPQNDPSAMRGKSMVAEVKKLPFAAVGAGDFVVTQVREQLRNLPTGTQRQMKQWQDRAGAFQERVGSMNAEVVRSAWERGLAQARGMYEEFADRGKGILAQRTPAVPPARNGGTVYTTNGGDTAKTNRATTNKTDPA